MQLALKHWASADSWACYNALPAKSGPASCGDYTKTRMKISLSCDTLENWKPE